MQGIKAWEHAFKPTYLTQEYVVNDKNFLSTNALERLNQFARHRIMKACFHAYHTFQGPSIYVKWLLKLEGKKMFGSNWWNIKFKFLCFFLLRLFVSNWCWVKKTLKYMNIMKAYFHIFLQLTYQSWNTRFSRSSWKTINFL